MSNNTKAMKIKQNFAKDAHITRLVILLIAVFVFLVIVKPDIFLKPQNFKSMATQFPEFGLMALGVMVAMITGGIDLSVVGVANMSAIGAALVLKTVIPADVTGSGAIGGIIITMVVGLLIGMLAGILNGILISKVKIPPILATLGSLELFTGIAIILTQGKPISGLPFAYSDALAGSIGGVVPIPLIVFIIATAIISFLMSKTTFGSKIYMMGTNAKAAEFSGLKVSGLLVKTYMISGMLAALAGLVMLANYNSAKADYGSAYTLQTVLIVILGGVNPNGGKGRVLGVVLAIVALQMLSSGLNMFPEISNFFRPLIWGGVLLAVMVADYFMDASKSRKLSKQAKTS